MTSTARTLDHSTDFQPCRINAVHPPAQAPEWGEWLRELGFMPGEQAMLMARAPGGDPLVVRIGSSTFALRRAEAACIEVTPLEKEAVSA
jgi:ferrous iron transport protein A